MTFLAGAPNLRSANPGLPHELDASDARSQFGMVATGSPEATEAAVAVLERGGNAVDAAVAAALVLGVADSDASGIGGMTYIVIRLAGGHAAAIDGTARAPMSLDMESMKRAKLTEREYGYEMVAVPTTLAVLDHAIRLYGTISLAEALQPAIAIARSGYRISPIQITWTRHYHEEILAGSDYLPYLFMVDGRTPAEPGQLFCNHDLAATLDEIARDGVASFYRGAIADRIEADMVKNGGNLRKSDLAMLRVRRVEPVTTTYRGVEVLSFPLPGGGQTLVEALDILETYPPAFLAADSHTRHQVFVDSVRIALSGRARSGAGLLPAAGPLATRAERKARAVLSAQMIEPGTALSEAAISGPVDPDCLPEGESTTQVSVIDRHGNAVSLTQTLGQSYGAKVATPGLGFVYNNFLSSFQVDKPHCAGLLRPRGPCPNDMAPTILVDDTDRVFALGTPGSSRIPSILASVVSSLFDRGMGLKEAVAAPRTLWEGGTDNTIFVEIAGSQAELDVSLFNKMGYERPVEPLHFPPPPVELADFGGVNAVAYDPASVTYTGVVDPRRGGLAQGPRAIAELQMQDRVAARSAGPATLAYR